MFLKCELYLKGQNEDHEKNETFSLHAIYVYNSVPPNGSCKLIPFAFNTPPFSSDSLLISFRGSNSLKHSRLVGKKRDGYYIEV